MLADIKKTEQGHVARFERKPKHSAEETWAWLTENGKLKLWFPELSCDEPREGGLMKFDMGDGSFEEMKITGFSRYSVLEYEWGEDTVRFELTPDPEGCRLVLVETIRRITEHTPRDLAGWHVCLDVIEALMDGKEIPSRREEWNARYEQYAQAIRAL